MQNLKNKALQLLRSSERLLKLDMVYIAKNSFWTSLSFVVGTLASIVSGIAFGNLLPREVYGTYNYLLSLGATLSFLTLSGTVTAVIRAVARGHENVVPAALRLQLKYNLVAIATVLVGAVYYGYKGNMVFAGSLGMLALAYPVAQAFHIYSQVLTGRKRFDSLTKITSLITVVSTLSTVVTIFLTHNVLILIAVYSLMSLLPNVIAYAIVTEHIQKSEPDPEQVKEMRRTSFHLTGAGLIGIAAQYVDKIMLFHVAGAATLAVYAFAIAGPDKLQSFVKNALSIALPNLAQKSLLEIHRIVYQRIALSIFLGTFFYLCYVFAAPFLFKLLLPHYLDAIFYSQVQALVLIIIPATIYIGSVFAQQNMLRATYALSTGSQVVYIILVLTLGWYWHIWGLIFASLLSAVLNAVYAVIIWELEFKRLTAKHE